MPFLSSSSTNRKKKRKNKQNRYFVHLNTRRKDRGESQKYAVFGLHLAIFVVVVGVIALFGWYVNKYMSTDEAFNIQDIVVENNVLISRHQILDTMGISEGLNLFSVDVKQCTRELLKLPSIKGVLIEKQYPAKIIVRVSERFPIFQFYKGCYFFVDEDGVILDTMSRQADPTLPVVVGIDIPVINFGTRLEETQLQLALQAVRAFNDSAVKNTINVCTIDMSKSDTVIFVTGKDQQIILGDMDFSYRFEKLYTIVTDLAGRRSYFDSVDLRFENVPVVMRN
ncbi:MAG: FtsQ-type POTRA domain-containing protein [Candidatus Auribacterota bacterium]|jgi:cell division protein FtsQ|nr:FtsQ-type POTRA domain-containing protein [Candidatus Auribacterota bacterium]